MSEIEKENHTRDAEFAKLLHGDTAKSSGLKSLLGKNLEAHSLASSQYFKYFDGDKADDDESVRNSRKKEYASLTKQYYHLATDLYEYGWGSSFHFCRFAPSESFHQALARHEHFLALKLRLKQGMRVLDVGCGVGGPAREISRFAEVHVTGLNNNDYQIMRANQYARDLQMEGMMEFSKGDFMNMKFPDGTFDAVYAIEATVHASSLLGVYSEIFRVLKPGGMFGVYEWVMKGDFDETDPVHRRIRLGIESGNGISYMRDAHSALEAIKAAGFEVEDHRDLAQARDQIPWYWPIAGEMKYATNLMDFFRVLRMTRFFRAIVHNLLGLGEMLRIIPSGTKKIADTLSLGADCLVDGAKRDLFTPMYFMLGRKPVA